MNPLSFRPSILTNDRLTSPQGRGLTSCSIARSSLLPLSTAEAREDIGKISSIYPISKKIVSDLPSMYKYIDLLIAQNLSPCSQMLLKDSQYQADMELCYEQLDKEPSYFMGVFLYFLIRCDDVTLDNLTFKFKTQIKEIPYKEFRDLPKKGFVEKIE